MRIVLLVLCTAIFSPAIAIETETFEDAVVIRSQLANGNTGICSGVLLTPTLVMTASHCIQNNTRHRVNRLSQASGWVPAKLSIMHPQYAPEKSYSAYDVGLLELSYPVKNPPALKPICKTEHWGEVVYRVGFGGRNGFNQKQIFSLQQSNKVFSTQTVVVPDQYSASGDSGGPIYAVENGLYCLFAIHSTVTVDVNGRPQVSYNPSISGAIGTLESMLPRQ